jgi:hypothetical protein
MTSRSGTCRDRRPVQVPDYMPGQLAQRGGDVGNHHGGNPHRPGGEHARRPGGHGGSREIVPVHPLSDDRGEQSSRLRLTRVADSRPGQPDGRVGNVVQRAVGDAGDFGKTQRDHGPSSPSSRRAPPDQGVTCR